MALSAMTATIHIVLPFFLLLTLNIFLIVCLKPQNRTVVNNVEDRRNAIRKATQGMGRQYVLGVGVGL